MFYDGKKTSPYQSLSQDFLWKPSVAGLAPAEIKPISDVSFRINEAHKVATAGSCFAQHVSRKLSQKGFNYFVTEKGSPFRTEKTRLEQGYGVFSARYGNVYTVRQFLQLVQRSLGLAEFSDQIYSGPYGLADGFRPGISARQGFDTAEGLLIDRRKHLARVKFLLQQADIFVFTLGLTETWISVQDGAVLPTCPGHSYGEYDPRKHVFYNMCAADVIEEFSMAVELIRQLNPKIKFVLSVSPVPLVATMSGKHILHANTYSKSVLRVACEELATNLKMVDYFPSYEIITGTFNTHHYYDANRRSVQEQGVDHVMRVFFETYTNKRYADQSFGTRNSHHVADGELVCDEDQLFEALAASKS